MASDERYSFIVEWYDTAASLVRTYNFTFFPKDKTIEMVHRNLLHFFENNIHQVDLKTKKIFLKRCDYPALQLKDLYVGAVITVYSRQLKVVEYADVHTRQKFDAKREK